MIKGTSNRVRTRVVVSAAVGLLTLASLVGCGSSSSDAPDTGQELTLYNDNPSWADGFDKAGKALQPLTGNSMRSVALPSTANYTQVVKASLNTDKPGDIIKWWSGKQLESLAATGKLTDLTDIWNSMVAKGWLDDALKPYYSYQDKVYALPLAQSYWTVFYNKSLFTKYNLAPPKTYEEFQTVAKTLKANGVTPIWTGQADGWTPFIPYQALLASVSPDAYKGLTDNSVKFSSPESVEALKVWQGWIKDGWVSSPDSKFADAPALVKSGKVAMFPIGTWAGSLMKAAGLEPDKDYGAFLMPPMKSSTPQAVYTEGGAWAIPVNAPHHKAAVKQLTNWLDPKVQEVWSDFLGDSSPNPTVAVKDPVIKALVEDIAAKKPMLLNRYYESLPPALVQDSTTSLGGFMVRPDDLDKVVKDLDAAAEKDWAEWKQQN
jgi:multiple sugar transport system substrate-binding protein